MMSPAWLTPSEWAFRGSLFIYLASFVTYLWAYFGPKRGRERFALWLLFGAWIVHTGALVFRWTAGGAWSPPWLGFYGLLGSLGWVMSAAYLFSEWRYKSLLRSEGSGDESFGAGAWLGASIGALLALGWLLPEKTIPPLPAVLHSPLLFVHVTSALFAYGFFLVSAFFALSFLIQDRVRADSIHAGFAAVSAMVFWVTDSAAPEWVALAPQFPMWVAGLFGFHFLLATLTSLVRKPSQRIVGRQKASIKNWLADSGERIDWITFLIRGVFLLAIVGLVTVLVLAVVSGRGDLPAALERHRYPFVAHGFLLICAVPLAALIRWRSHFEEKLPVSGILDRLVYHAVVIGFAFLNVGIFAGAAWAQVAWGRYWGWDPKEIWAFATWLVYLIYFHLRLAPEWKPRGTAVLAVIAFFVVLFTFLGTNLWLPGLHRFGWGG